MSWTFSFTYTTHKGQNRVTFASFMILTKWPPLRLYFIYIFTNKTALRCTLSGHDEIKMPCIKIPENVSLWGKNTFFNLLSLHSLSYINLAYLFWNETGKRAKLIIYNPLTLLCYRRSSCGQKTVRVGEHPVLYTLITYTFVSFSRGKNSARRDTGIQFQFNLQFHINVRSRPQQQARWPKGYKSPWQNMITCK